MVGEPKELVCCPGDRAIAGCRILDPTVICSDPPVANQSNAGFSRHTWKLAAGDPGAGFGLAIDDIGGLNSIPHRQGIGYRGHFVG